MSNNQNQGASIEAERAAFEVWAKDHLGQGYPLTIDEGAYEHPVTRWAFKVWRAALRTPAAAVGAGELPPLPPPLVATRHGTPCYTVGQALDIQREAFEAGRAAADRAQRQAPATVTAPAQPAARASVLEEARVAVAMCADHTSSPERVAALADAARAIRNLAAPAAQQAAPTGTLGYALFRNGKQEGIERSWEMAKRWVKAEIVPLIAAPATAGIVEDGLSDEQCAEICAEAQAKLEANAKDAARYRHLRSGKWFEQGFAKTEPNASAFHYAGELLDSKVDAALAAQQAQDSAKGEQP